ncbi:sensor histidine kinase [Hansschlegelia sp. KR7-227]|uniref:sensor histidine kinase n=1 Tax=Hansschlegelia sp. KR7-227 TaxID=3400914 RepID=UPI003BFEBE3E
MTGWLSCFLAGSIRRQIQIVALGPVLTALLVGMLIQPSIQDDISYASKVAIRIQLVVGQVAAAKSAEEAAAILAMTSKTGLGVQKLPPEQASKGLAEAKSADDLHQDVWNQLPASLSPAVRRPAAGGARDQVITVTLGDGDVLAFSPEPQPPISFLDEDRVDFVLKIFVVVVPLLLLSFYANTMIMVPLTRFARAAHALDPDDGPDRPFEETGVREISLLARALNDMRARIRQMIDERTRMVRAISHDLRTPLTRLRMRAERSSDDALRDAMLADIVRIDAMIQETLTYLQREVASEATLRVDLPSLLQTVCYDFANMDFPVSYQGPYRLAFDCKPQALVRAVTNLVENGVKFAHVVTVRLKPLADGSVRIEVADDGPGIPEELRVRVLEPFFKADASRSAGAQGGFGLGLSIVHDVVGGHGGSMVLLDAEPQGLVVRLHLPAPLGATGGGYVREPPPKAVGAAA